MRGAAAGLITLQDGLQVTCVCCVVGEGREREREGGRERDQALRLSRRTYLTYSVARHDVLVQQNIQEDKAETSTAKLSYVNNACCIFSVTKAHFLSSVPKAVFRLTMLRRDFTMIIYIIGYVKHLHILSSP